MIKISRRNQGSSKGNHLLKELRKVHHHLPLLLLSSLSSSRINLMIKRKFILRVRGQLKNSNGNLKTKVNSNNSIKRLSTSNHPLSHNRNNNRSHKRKSTTISSNLNNPNLRDLRASSRPQVLSWLKASTLKRTSRCTSAPRSVNSLSLREGRSHLTLKSRCPSRETLLASIRLTASTLTSKSSVRSMASRLRAVSLPQKNLEILLR